MILGTAGFTAALAVDKLEASACARVAGRCLVTGATGGVGSVAVMLLSRLGYEVAAVTGKSAAARTFSRRIGAKEILGRDALTRRRQSTDVEGTVGRCGRHRRRRHAVQRSEIVDVTDAASRRVDWLRRRQFAATVLPFILRHVNLLGIDSVQLPLAEKARIWNKLAGPWQLERLDTLKVDFYAGHDLLRHRSNSGRRNGWSRRSGSTRLSRLARRAFSCGAVGPTPRSDSDSERSRCRSR